MAGCRRLLDAPLPFFLVSRLVLRVYRFRVTGFCVQCFRVQGLRLSRYVFSAVLKLQQGHVLFCTSIQRVLGAHGDTDIAIIYLGPDNSDLRLFNMRFSLGFYRYMSTLGFVGLWGFL